jgi:protocatechuate 3,4-dioxygenase beta subunit
MPQRRLIPLGLLLLALRAAAAAELPVCPAWEITVVDPAGRPLAGCAVLQMWGCNFQEAYTGSQTNATTDAQGRVRFPARHISPPAASAWRKAVRKLDREAQPRPVASLCVSHPGHQTAWISSHRDPAVTATRDGLRTRLVLEPEPAKP